MSKAGLQKFDLYIKARQMRQVQAILDKVRDLAPEQRQAWLKDNSIQVEEAFDHFVDESNQVLSHVGLDQESLKLSQTIIKGLRDSMTLVGDVVYRQQELES